MNRLLVPALFLLVFCTQAFAQQALADSPASKEDVQRFFVAAQSRSMLDKFMDAMSKPMHQMVHEDYLKNKDKLPPDYEERMNKEMDSMLKDMPFQEMMDAMIPAYQKHFTKGDIEAFIAFYSSPSGQKMLQELPGVMTDGMQAMMPIMRKYGDQVTQRIEAETAEMLKGTQNRAPTAN